MANLTGDPMNSIWRDFEEDVIRETERAADSIARDISREQGDLKYSVRELAARVDRLALVCRAMHELLESLPGMSKEMLAEKITEIDLRDGLADGRASPTPTKCPQCGSMICKKFNRCLFCGYRDPSGDPFDTI